MHHCYLLAKILCQITFQKFLHFVNGTVVVDDIIWDYKYMILHILRSYGIIKPTEKWNVPNNERILKAVQYLSLIKLIKPAKVYVLAHHWHNLTAVSKVPWKEQSSVGTLSQYSSNNNNYYYHYISLLPKSLFYSNREKEHPLLRSPLCLTISLSLMDPIHNGVMKDTTPVFVITPCNLLAWRNFWFLYEKFKTINYYSYILKFFNLFDRHFCNSDLEGHGTR